MRKYVVLLGILISTVLTAFAYKITSQEAQIVALNFFKVNVQAANKLQINASLKYTKIEADNTIDFYVFNMTPVTGFVIVSADDNIVPVIGYSTESSFEPEMNLTGLKDWMGHASSNIYKGILQNEIADSRIAGLWSAYRQGQNPGIAKSNTVAPLIKTAWNQSPIYNDLCPFNATDGQRCVTGCVATTMAQIMKYWSYPAKGFGSFSYTDGWPGYSHNYGLQSADFGSTTYNWTGMPLYVSNTNNYVSTLMYQCGVSVAMDYGDETEGGSGAAVLASQSLHGHSAQQAFVDYFSYDPNTIQGIIEAYYTADEWLTLIKGELDAGRPVQYEGFDPTGGHTWVCDGYDQNDMLHMNWGWGGSSNGYFLVSNLSAGGYNFSSNEGALIGIQPIRAGVQATAIQTSLCKGDTTILIASASSEIYSWTPTTGLSCPTCAYTNAYPVTTTTYTVKIDSSGFTGTSSITVTVNPKLVISGHSAVGANCFGASNGAASISVSGGTPNYSYLWNNGNTNSNNNNLAAGNYQVVVHDAGGCSVSLSESISQPAQIIITPQITDAACTSANGDASVSVTGGTGSEYSYLWNTGATTNSISNLAAGPYTVTVTNNGCTTVSNIMVNEPYQINFNTAVSPSTGTNGSAVIEDITGGLSPYTYKWSNSATTASVSNLAPGNYLVTVTDQSGCYETALVAVNLATGVNHINNAISFNLYPNPAKSEVMIELGHLDNGTILNLENILGQKIYTKELTEVQTQIDLSQFTNGVYVVELNQNGRRAVKQLVLNK